MPRHARTRSMSAHTGQISRGRGRTSGRASPTEGRNRRETEPTLEMQRRAGNRAVGRMQLGAPDTAHERNADRVADDVLRGRSLTARPGRARRGALSVPRGVEGEIDAARGGGRPLPHGLRQRLQRSMSADLSGVRVHTDDRAHRISTAIDAEAAATGKDIFFRRGRYRPKTPGGLRTLTHEVTHTLQHGRDQGLIQRKMWRWCTETYRKSDTSYAWRDKDDKKTVNAELLEELGEGNENDIFDDVSRLLIPYGVDKFGQKGLDRRRQKRIDSKDVIERRKAQVTRRAKARRTLAGCDTLTKLAAKLPDAGYNYSTVPNTYLEALTEYRTFKAKKTFGGGARAKLALRLALRDLADETALGDDPATDYMEQAKRREETVSKSTGFATKYKWTQFGSIKSTDFGKWALGEGGAPGDRSTMNCWESVLWGGFKSGHLRRESVRDAYLAMESVATGKSTVSTREGDGPRPVDDHGTRDDDYIVPLEQVLFKGKPREYKLHDPDQERPLKGDIVVYGKVSDHVAIAEGNMTNEPQVVSLYDKPNSVDSVQRVPISSFMGETAGYAHERTWLYRPFWS